MGPRVLSRNVTLPRGAPWLVKLRVRLPDGSFGTLAGRDLSLSIFDGEAVFVAIAGEVGVDGVSQYQRFALSGGQTQARVGARAQWEIAQLFDDGKVPLIGGALTVVAAARSAIGDGTYADYTDVDELEWAPQLAEVIVVEKAARGIDTMAIDGEGHLIVTLTDGTVCDAGALPV